MTYENQAATVAEWTPDPAIFEECAGCRGTARGCDSKRLWQGDFCCARCPHDEILVHHAPSRAPSRPVAPMSGSTAQALLEHRRDTTNFYRKAQQ